MYSSNSCKKVRGTRLREKEKRNVRTRKKKKKIKVFHAEENFAILQIVFLFSVSHRRCMGASAPGAAAGVSTCYSLYHKISSLILDVRKKCALPEKRGNLLNRKHPFDSVYASSRIRCEWIRRETFLPALCGIIGTRV